MNYKREKKIIIKKLNRMHDNIRDRDFLLSNGTLYQKEVTERKMTDMAEIRRLIHDLKIFNKKIELEKENGILHTRMDE